MQWGLGGRGCIQVMKVCVSALESWASVAASVLAESIAVPRVLDAEAIPKAPKKEPSQASTEVVRASVSVSMVPRLLSTVFTSRRTQLEGSAETAVTRRTAEVSLTILASRFDAQGVL